MNERTMMATRAVLFGFLSLAGCVDNDAQKQREQELKAQHLRELQLTEQTASATATTQALRSQQTAIERARQDGYSAGEATGRVAAMKDRDRRTEKARQNGHQSGLIEGEAKGHTIGFEEGEKVGYAKAAVEEFKKGQKQGELYGEIKGRSTAEKEANVEIELAETKAEARGIKQGRIDGFAEGKEVQRQESYYKIVSVVVCVSASFVSLLFFTYTRLAPNSALALRRLREEELRREAERWALAQKLEERLLDIVEKGRPRHLEQPCVVDEDDSQVLSPVGA